MREHPSSQIATNRNPDSSKTVNNYKPEDLAFELLDVPEWRKHLSTHIVNAIFYTCRLLARNRLLIVNEINLLFLAGTFLAPLFISVGWYNISAPFYSLFCLQRPTHSIFLVGYQMGMEVRVTAPPAKARRLLGIGYPDCAAPQSICF